MTYLISNQTEIINTIKILIYKENAYLLKKIDFEDDSIFLEPLIFAYFNSKSNSLFTNNILEEIMQGYFVERESLLLDYSCNRNGVSYIPKLGYFSKGIIKDGILNIGHFEILKEIHPLIERYFRETYKGHVINPNPTCSSVWQNHHQVLEKSIIIIKEHLPAFYAELVFANKKIYLHDNPKILNFTTIETLGMLYFYVIGNDNLIYFIEELIHQGSHNFLYYIVHNRKDYFKIDVDTIIMRDLTKQDWDYRNIYGAFHGLYTVTKRVECFDILLSKNVFSGKEKHELLGRFTDQFIRFKTGLELLDLDKVYTDKGKEFYNELSSKCEKILDKYKILPSIFDLSNRDVDFRYDDYCKLNPIKDFYINEANGTFNFNK